MNKKILILGTSSFGGSSLAKFLLDQKINVIGTYNKKKNNFYQQQKFSKNIKLYKEYKINLIKDLSKLKKIINKFKPTHIVDFASICMVAESWDKPDYYFDINCSSKAELLNFLKKVKFLKNYLYISTPEVFGSKSFSVKEDHQHFNPSTPYAVSKLAAEQLIKSFSKTYAIPYNICRFSNFYGIGQPNYRLIPKVITSILSKKKFPLEGGGKSERNFIDADDFSNGIFKVITRGKINKTYHFSSKEIFKIYEIVKIICDELNVEFKNVIIKKKDRPGKDKRYSLNSNRTQKELKWSCKVDLKKNLKYIVQYYLFNKRKISKLKLDF